MLGKTLNHYKVGEQLGRGGMGEVYVADDLNLNRKVALKFLPDAFTGDPERMARFEREAKVLASLNHPNIAAIYGLEQAEAKRFIVMELVEGETLAQRLGKGPLPIDEALGICKQITEGLEAAHEKGVIHRDLKPANVMITDGDKVKILDFGLAKALSGETQLVEASQSPTLTEAMTRPGIILGTAAYMSPEQAKGKAVDKRADIWAFGCILYECLTGKRAFEGETVTETLAAIITREIEWEKVPARTCPLLHQCLEKDPKKRLRDIGDAYALLEWVPLSAPVKVPWLAWGIAALAVLAAAILSLLYLRETPQLSPVDTIKFRIELPDKVVPAPNGTFALSPDGRHLAFDAVDSNGVRRLWMRELNSLEARPLLGAESSHYFSPFWSPDSRFIAFQAGGKLKKISVSGGVAETICDLSGMAVGGSWNREGVIIFGDYLASNGIMKVSASGGTPSQVTMPNQSQNETIHFLPVFLPDGRHFLYHNYLTHEKRYVRLGSIDSKPAEQESKQLLFATSGPVYFPSQDSGMGQLLFLLNQTLMAQPFDERRLQTAGEAVPIEENVGYYLNYGYFSASTNGILVVRSGASFLSQPTWYDRKGKILGTAGETGLYYGIAIAPGGLRAAYGIQSTAQASMYSDVHLLDFARGIDTRFTYGQSLNTSPIWSPNGNRIIFASSRNGKVSNLYQKASGSGMNDELLLKSNENNLPTNCSADGRFLLYVVEDPKTRYDLWVLPMEGERKPAPFLKTEFNEFDGRFSPDMRWIAYVSDESGSNEIYVRAFSPGAGGTFSVADEKWLISKAGGTGPRWRGNGNELYYVARDGKVMAVAISGGATFHAGTPQALFQTRDSSSVMLMIDRITNWDATSGGDRFLLTLPPEDASRAAFTVFVNWTALLKK